MTAAASAAAAAVARIDLAALRHNLRQARSAAPNSRIMAVIKGNGYGHGIVPIARALEEADGLAVARVHEALVLREAGIAGPLLVLEGFQDREELQATIRFRLLSTLFAEHQIALLESCTPAPEPALDIWLKLDTGMHRLGFPPQRLAEITERLGRIRGVNLACVMSHFASADDRSDPFTEQQISTFRDALGQGACATSLANSAGLLGWSASHGDWVRPGIMLYGASPFVDGTAVDAGLRPVMTFSSRVIAINEMPAGARVGYRGRWTSGKLSRIGVVAAGYADGYPREAPDGTPLLVNGVRAPLAGIVSMDMLTVDLTAHPDAAIGDEVILWGEGLPVEEVAAHVGTIPYVLFCGITLRTRFEYLEN